MDIFDIHRTVIDDYRAFTSGFVDIRDPRIREFVTRRLDSGAQWPDPWISLNPSFESGGTIPELVRAGLLHPECERIFRVKQHRNDAGSRPLTLHRHQRDAIEAAHSGKSYVLTTGTGSGKSLAYIVPIVDSVLRERTTNEGRRLPGVKAIIVYPMNALANSQLGELEKFLRYGYPDGGEPVTFARYTGQESPDQRRAILADPPDILLTNYVMLELVLTRPDESKHLIRAAQGLRFLVLDELHTYRGRQGADVGLLVRRLRDACSSPALQTIGTSATMATGTPSASRAQVADVATRLFGAPVTPNRVIGETLRRATTQSAGPSERSATEALALKHAVRATLDRSPGSAPRAFADLAADLFAAWLESTFGLDHDGESGALVRRKPTRIPDAAHVLSSRTGLDQDACDAAIRALLHEGAHVTDPQTARPLFAFRVHQFLSKGDTVYVSLEPEDVRHITDMYQLRVPGEPGKALLPLGFCRECGQEYLVVAKVYRNGTTQFVPRRDADASGGDAVTGYLYVSSDLPWPTDPATEGRLPDHWLVPNGSADNVVVAAKAKYLPTPVWLAPDGSLVAEGAARPNDDALQAWFVSTPFAFCLRCRVSYEQIRGNDFAKLATLDQEGRSSAVTIVTAGVVRALRGLPEAELPADARKLLTFVDNRQDASLQAGHFNDFVQVAQLRGALHAAMSATVGGLTHEVVATRVADALGLTMADFAANPQAKFSARDQAWRALRAVVEYRLYTDLQRGWRVTMPNLEQTGLLHVGYVDLPELAADEDSWSEAHTALASARPKLREELGRILLDELRRVLAIDVPCLSADGFEQLIRESRQQLVGAWTIGDGERLVQVGTAFARSGQAGSFRGDLNISGRSAYGRYLRRADVGLAAGLSVTDAQDIITDLLRVLERAGLLTVVAASDGIPGYRIKASALRWVAGDGSEGADDPLRRTLDSESTARVNPFFLSLYSDVAASLAGLHALEHTAQVPPEERERREEAFRPARLPLLFCSPTMELGVDIAGLNAVAMRNVPPTPANYAQRSGRAGRSGQPALVVTYCATGNSHDSYYFRHSRDMVAGSVIPPRLDLANEDLVRSHVNAIWLAETDQSMRARITDLVEAAGESPSLTILPEVWRALTDDDARRTATHRAERVITELRRTWEAARDPVPWWYDGWVGDQVAQAPKALDAALDRWRGLYRAALVEYHEQSKLAVDAHAQARIRDAAARRATEARNQLTLLRNEDSDLGQTDFYSYRYLASEGFLPGYSFPRLPLAAYIPGGRAGGRGYRDGDYIQRPRFLAISEFGPGALIYHEGARYEVTRVQLPRGQADRTGIETEDARRCFACGYHHSPQVGTDICDSCGEALGGRTYGLLRLQTVFTRRRERISSDEEERRRSGYELEISYRFTEHGDRPGKVDATARLADRTLASLAYGDSATIRLANVGRRRRKNPADRGYWIDPVEGRWLSEKKADDAVVDAGDLDAAEDVARKAKVIPYVEDRRNILVLRLADTVDDATATTLRYALERGIEAEFQLEDSELESRPLPDLHARGRMLLTESAEGGAGALRRLVAEPGALAAVARRALTIAHFDDRTGADLDHADGAQERCESACYDCLLSYSNQLDHALIDRHRARQLLLDLAGSTVATGAGGRTRGEQRRILDQLADSTLERRFVEWLDEHDLRLPDRAQVTVPDAQARPDLVYDLPGNPVAVFVDGPIHDTPTVTERDTAAEERLIDAGWHVLRVRYDDDWHTLTSSSSSVFGKVSGRPS